MIVRLRPQAETDIEEIVIYIAEESPTAALHWYDNIHRLCERIGEMPRMGRLAIAGHTTFYIKYGSAI